MRKWRGVWFGIAALVTLSGVRAEAQNLQVHYVPFVHAQLGSKPVPGSGDTLIDVESWESTLSAFNPGDSAAEVVLAAIYGKGAVLSSVSVPPIPAHQGRGLMPSVSPVPDRGVGFLEVHTGPGVILVGEVERTTQRSSVSQPYSTTFSHGGVSLPIFRTPFPSGSVTISGAVELGQLGLADSGYPPAMERRRRMNVTLFNAGGVNATFIIRTLPLNSATAALTEQTVSVAPGDVVQLNSFPLPAEASASLTSGNGYAIWVEITADQPFLSYVSTVFGALEPTDMPFAVYPSHLPE